MTRWLENQAKSYNISMFLAGIGTRQKAWIQFYPCKLFVTIFSMFIQFKYVRAVLKGVAPNEVQLYQPMLDQIPHGRQWIDPHAFGLITRERIIYAT